MSLYNWANPYSQSQMGALGGATTGYSDLGNKGMQIYGAGQGIQSKGAQVMIPALYKAASAAEFDPSMVEKAGVTAQQAYNQQRQGLIRQLTRMGVNPNSGRFAGLMQDQALNAAAGIAGAKTEAQRAERNAQFANLANLVGLGSGVSSQGAAMMGQGLGEKQAGLAGMMQLAGDYGDLASQQSQMESMQKAQAQNDLQMKLDQMFA